MYPQLKEVGVNLFIVQLKSKAQRVEIFFANATMKANHGDTIQVFIPHYVLNS